MKVFSKTSKPVDKAKVPSTFWAAIIMSATLFIYILSIIFVNPHIFFALFLVPCLGIAAAIVVALLALIKLGMNKDRRQRKYFLAAFFLAAFVPAFFLLGGLPRTLAAGWRVYAARTVDLSKLQAWAVTQLRSKPQGGFLKQDDIPSDLQAFVGNFKVLCESGTSGQNIQDPPHLILVTGGGVMEMHQGLMIGDSDYKPPYEHGLLEKWGKGIWFFFK